MSLNQQQTQKIAAILQRGNVTILIGFMQKKASKYVTLK